MMKIILSCFTSILLISQAYSTTIDLSEFDQKKEFEFLITLSETRARCITAVLHSQVHNSFSSYLNAPFIAVYDEEKHPWIDILIKNKQQPNNYFICTNNRLYEFHSGGLKWVRNL